MEHKSLNIALIGYMTSGKSTIGKLLSKELNSQFIDSDEIIFNASGYNASEYFEKLGEEKFRRAETNFLKNNFDNVVLATGGGMPCFNGNIELLNSQFITVYLKVSEHIIVKRLIAQKKNTPRPLVNYSNVLEDTIKRIKDRIPIYEQAKHTVNADGSIELVMKSILAIINQYSIKKAL